MDSLLEAADMDLALSPRALRYLMPQLRERSYELSKLAHQKKLPVIVVFEGWDGSGKNRNIRELSRRLDPRGFKVRETQPPLGHELLKPWLWRFWMQIPRRGQIVIFDRSWYGRVLVERVEGITPMPDWIRAYEEINAFERTLADDGTVFIKLWMHIDREEQLRRFIRWTHDPAESWQVAAEDWDHHHKYDAYLAACRDVLSNTDQPDAPWNVVPANDEPFATYQVFRTLIDRLEVALGVEPTTWLALEELEAQALEAEKDRERRRARKRARKTAKREARLKAALEAGESDALAGSEGGSRSAASPPESELPAPDPVAKDHDAAPVDASETQSHGAGRG